jgi:hypothetical protein
MKGLYLIMKGMNPWILGMLIVFLAAVLFGIYVVKATLEKEAAPTAITKCINLCKEMKAKGVDLSNGPCLSNNIAPGWVCDVAHNPRLPVDDKPENQCSAFREGKATHFVEVDENCNVIRVY